MHFQEFFVTTAGQVGLLAVFTEFILVVTAFSFFGMTLFSLASKGSVAPEHRTSSTLSAVICFVAGCSYLVIRTYYHAMLETLAKLPLDDAKARHDLIYGAYFAIGQFRYMDWTVTTPLLLLKTVETLKIKPRQIPGLLTVLLLADVLMVVTGYIGEQQIGPDGVMRAGPHYTWGTISTVFYLVIPVILYKLYQTYAAGVEPEERRAYRWLAWATVTTWGVYPLGYMVPTLFPDSDMNWIHVAFSIGDVWNKVALGVVAYLAGTRVLEKVLPKEDVQAGRTVG
ncbi:MAG: bacteriorhodopsin [Rhodospirillales bacterium]|nr:bacteriorhodopsin [Acetobacter sp.]